MSVQKFKINVHGEQELLIDLAQYLKRIEQVLRSWYGWEYEIDIVYNDRNNHIFSLHGNEIPPMELIRWGPYLCSKGQTIIVPLINFTRDENGFFIRYNDVPSRIHHKDFDLQKPSAHWIIGHVEVCHGNEPSLIIDNIELAIFKFKEFP